MMTEQYSPADILAQRLDMVLPPGKSSIPPATPDVLVNTAAMLAQVLVPALPARLSNRIEARTLRAFDAQYRFRGRFRRPETVLRWALVASLTLVLLLAGMTPAVAASLPGEPLYSVKQLY
jgi:hypothetical protein